MYKKTVLDNSIRIVTEKLPSRLISIGVWVDVGSRDEDDLTNGIAHFAEHMFFKGTRFRSAYQIAKELDVLGGMSNAFTSTEHTCFYITVLDSQLTKAVDLLADIFLDSVFSQEEIDRERQVILQEIAMVEDTPDDKIHELFTSLFWQGNSLANTVLGKREVVEGLDSKSLREYVRGHYGADRIIVSAAGNVDHQLFTELWRDRLAGVPRADSSLTKRQLPAAGVVSGAEIVERPLEQAHMVTGTRGLAINSDDRYKLLLLNVLLGGNMSSRLFQEIREKRGLAYSIYSYLSSSSDCGYLAVYLGVAPSSFSEAIGLIDDEFVRLQEGGITAEELAGAADYARGGVYLASENMEVRMTSLARNEYSFGRYVSIEDVVGGIDRVRPGEIVQLAGELFAQERRPLAVIGPISDKEIQQVTG
ncbi:MAG: pitrilysin family protein [Thermodesulfobacteriota bacterium]